MALPRKYSFVIWTMPLAQAAASFGSRQVMVMETMPLLALGTILRTDWSNFLFAFHKVGTFSGSCVIQPLRAGSHILAYRTGNRLFCWMKFSVRYSDCNTASDSDLAESPVTEIPARAARPPNCEAIELRLPPSPPLDMLFETGDNTMLASYCLGCIKAIATATAPHTNVTIPIRTLDFHTSAICSRALISSGCIQFLYAAPSDGRDVLQK